jgi:hypothetical protein
MRVTAMYWVYPSWEQQCHDPTSDTYAPISWSSDADDWEAAHASLAHIIDGQYID